MVQTAESSRAHTDPHPTPTHLSASPLGVEKRQVRAAPVTRARLCGWVSQHLGGGARGSQGSGRRRLGCARVPGLVAPRASQRCAPPPRAAPGQPGLSPERPVRIPGR